MEIDSVDPEVLWEINAINKVPSDAKQARFTSLLDTILSTPQSPSIEQNLNAYVVNLLSGDANIPGVVQSTESISIATLRPLLDNFIEKFSIQQLRHARPDDAMKVD